MTYIFTSQLKIGAVSLLAIAASQLGTAPASLAQAPPPVAPAAPEAPAPTPMTTPAMAGPLLANPAPLHAEAGPLGTVYVTGAASGLALFQNDPITTLGDRHKQFDISNGQVSIQNTEGLVQFFAQAGIYSFPTVGVPYTRAATMTGNSFGALPVAYLKLAPTDNFSIQAGKLPTLIGAEYMYTFQNMNIQRGLLWNQENIVNRGVQANLGAGPLAFSLSWNDGFYSDRYNWLTGAATWTIDSGNSLILAGGGPLGRNTATGFATPLAQNNSTIIDLSYTYNAAPWTITPYVQYTHVGADAALGFGQNASTYGGAILAGYKINDNVSLAGRFEYIASTGSAANGAPDLLGYGPGSSAMSFTLTPTFQQGIFFVRGEASVTQLFDINPAASAIVFGKNATAKTQARWLLEAGVVF